MALKPTIYKVELQLSDTDRHCYESCNLTLAQHPSETLQRLMVRLLVFALNYDPDLSFTKGLSSTDEPDLWRVAADGQVEQWIEVGQASPERMRKAVSRAPEILLYAYGRETDIWWQKHGAVLSALPKLTVWRFDDAEVSGLERFVNRSMQLTLTISDGELYLSDASEQQTIKPVQLSLTEG